MAKTRRTYGWGCPVCNMQAAGFQDADMAWQEANIHTASSGHVTDTFFRVDTQITTLYPTKETRQSVLTSVHNPIEDIAGKSAVEEQSGQAQPKDPARADFSPELIRAADEAAKKLEEDVATEATGPAQDKVS